MSNEKKHKTKSSPLPLNREENERLASLATKEKEPSITDVIRNTSPMWKSLRRDVSNFMLTILPGSTTIKEAIRIVDATTDFIYKEHIHGRL